MIFVMSTTPDLLPTVKILGSHPQAYLVKPDDQPVNLLKQYLPRLEKIEGRSIEEFL